MKQAIAAIIAAGQVNWLLLLLALGILVAFGVWAVVHVRRSNDADAAPDEPIDPLDALEPSNSLDPIEPVLPRAPTPPGQAPMVGEYDLAYARGDYSVAAALARRDNSLASHAEALEATGELDRAVSAWLELKEFGRAGDILERHGRTMQAAEAYAQGGLYARAAEIYISHGQTERAADMFRQGGDEKTASRMEGEELAAKGSHMKAAHRFVAAGLMERAAEQLLKAGDVPKAVEALRRGGMIAEGARLLVKSGDFDKAARLFEEIGSWLEAAECYGRVGETAKQARALHEAGESYRAGRLAFENGDYGKAMEYFEAVPAGHRKYPNASLLRGQILEHRGHQLQAVDAYGVWLENRAPEERNRHLFTRVARIYQGVGKTDEARKLVERIVSAGVATDDVKAFARELAVREARRTGLDFPAVTGEPKPAEPAPQAPLRVGGEAFEAAPAPTDELRPKVSPPIDWSGPPVVVEPSSEPARLQPDLEPPTEAAGLTLPDALLRDSEVPALKRLAERYIFGQRVGQGGNGVVYMATDRKLGRKVVVKFLHQALLPTDIARKYFLREAKTAASLSHPNIVTIYDIGEEDDVLYYSMELLEGKTLADLIVDSGGLLTHEQALPLIEQLCDALDYAHSRQVIHRDIKPGNIMVSPSGLVKLLDFGLAKALDENPDKSVFLCGTPFYMSPEQIQRDLLDHRADIYSLGCLLYVIYTGDVPFPEGNVFYHQRQTQPPDPRQRVSDLPEGIGEVLVKCIQKDRNGRYQRAGDVARALAAVPAR